MSDWKVTRLAGALGAEITGFNLAGANGQDIDRVKALLLEHKVIFFPGQSIDIEEHVALGRQFGQIESHPNLKNPFTQHPEVFELAATHGGVADEWHTDITFQDSPSMMSILHMVKCPEVGGDTMWTSLSQAYDELSEPMQSLCEGLSALHDAHPHNRPQDMAVHPVVRVHPETGAKALYVNEHFTRRIVEMNATESRVILDYLTEWVKNPRFTVRYKWTPGTIAFWDNRCTQHFVLNDFEGERIIQRVTVMGDEVKAAAAPQWEPWVRDGRASATTRLDRQLNSYMKAKRAKLEAV
ncbi:MAG: taurine dioxygenase [Gammaproteobacteria bacterium]|jgi:taurine dioxygenase|nr:taurine dioxygenase [Gammaproteobacteria bacterium]MBT3694128.1 taurine dioxygenase [Gammaproteobacteria bacterium]MBT5334657.1 taurine dioxygenase [Gammaproteobacteria bacterium]MBT5682234.1 taurine dioxygenase [Gammaproteobacteria bacterium]MBT6025594.1 taurine dioxygenase [Gammaproteobacteria bacterium]